MSRQVADVIIIGGGIIGTSTAYYLAQRKIDALVLEQGYLGAGASGANAAIIGSSSSSPVSYAVFEERSKTLFSQLFEDLGERSPYDSCGRLSLIRTNESLEDTKDRICRNAEAGINVMYVTASQLADLEPHIAAEQTLGAAFCPTDGRLDPFDALRIIAFKAQRLGATFRYHTYVQRLRVSSRSVRIQTDQGTYSCESAIIAAGIDTPRLTSSLGMSMYVTPLRGQILVTEILPQLFRHVISPGITQCRHGNVLLGVSTEDVGLDTTNSLSVLQEIARGAIAKAPVLKDARIIRCFSGLRPMPLDHLPIIDHLPEHPSVFVAVSHNAITSSQAIGQALASWIADRRRDECLSPFSISRPSLCNRGPYSRNILRHSIRTSRLSVSRCKGGRPKRTCDVEIGSQYRKDGGNDG